MLRLERLRVLHAISTTGSVVAAARTLHLTTSAVSQQIARLEQEVGEPLTERHGRGIRLTDAGAHLARAAGELLAHAERVESDLARQRGAVAGSLTIAAFATAARGLLPAGVRELRSRYPQLAVSVREQEPHEAVPAVARGDADLAVVQDWAESPLTVPATLERQHLLDDAFDVAVPATHPLAGRRSVRIDELADAPWIGWSAGEICHDWLARTLRRSRREPQILHTASEHSTQLALVAAELGVAVIPRLGRETPPPGVRFVAITPQPVRRIFALWRETAAARPAIGAALDALRHTSPAIKDQARA
jgi:molybdate transport repressor ModE-like protein